MELSETTLRKINASLQNHVLSLFCFINISMRALIALLSILIAFQPSAWAASGCMKKEQASFGNATVQIYADTSASRDASEGYRVTTSKMQATCLQGIDQSNPGCETCMGACNASLLLTAIDPNHFIAGALIGISPVSATQAYPSLLTPPETQPPRIQI